MQKLTKERGREENPRQDGKRRRGQRSGGGGLKDGIGSLKKVGEHLAHRQRKRESPRWQGFDANACLAARRECIWSRAIYWEA